MTDSGEKKMDIHEAMRMLHNNARENLNYCKKQQWQVAYYTLLLYGAIVVAPKGGITADWFIISLGAISAMLLAGSVSVIVRLECSQRAERCRIRKIERDYFPKEYQDMAWNELDVSYCARRPSHLTIYRLLLGVTIFGGAATLLLLLNRLCEFR